MSYKIIHVYYPLSRNLETLEKDHLPECKEWFQIDLLIMLVPNIKILVISHLSIATIQLKLQQNRNQRRPTFPFTLAKCPKLGVSSNRFGNAILNFPEGFTFPK